MRSRRIFGRMYTWAPLLALLASCERPSSQESSTADAEVVGPEPAAVPQVEPDTEVAPPQPIVADDPDIPLNEAVVGTKPVPPDYSADVAPPPPVFEEPPRMAASGQVWVPGYWWWSRPLHRYVWVSGAWRSPPPEHVWTAGTWLQVSPQRYVWRPGFWAPRGYPPVEVIEVAPPPLRVEVIGRAPGAGVVWTPGYYAYRSQAYVWSPGTWSRPPGEGLIWVEPRYVAIGGRYHFQPGRWDLAPERRGTVYRPDVDVRPGAHVAFVPVSASVVVAHVSFVTASTHAIAVGATRTPSGTYVTHHAPSTAQAAPPARDNQGDHDHDKPGAHDKPGSADKPGGSDKPGDHDKPGPSDKPGDHDKPAASGKASDHEKPAASAKPGDHDKPAGSSDKKPDSKH